MTTSWCNAAWMMGASAAVLFWVACSLDSSGTATPTTSATSSTVGPGPGGGGGTGGLFQTGGFGGQQATGSGGSTGGNGGSGGSGGAVGCSGSKEVANPTTMRCYHHINNNVTWNEARIDCQMWGGDLVGISSQEEFDFVLNTVESTLSINDYWIGGYNQAADNTPANYIWINMETWGALGWGLTAGQLPWKGGHPSGSQSCVKLKNDVFESTSCNGAPPGRFLCEKSL